jgi:hypothetical protein
MGQGGEKMPPEIARARFAAAGNLDKMNDYGYAYGGYIPQMTYGGYDYMAEGGEPNGGMALGQMSAVADKMSKLRQFVSPEQNLDPWIASKLAVMDESADAISDYMMYNPEAQEGSEEEMMMANGGQMIRRADGSYSRRGLWDNIRANKGSGKKPTKQMLKQESKIRAQEKEYGGNVYNYAYGGGIQLDPAKRGTFKAQATRMGMGVQEAASAILNAPEGKYSPAMRKKANFAKNFAKQEGGQILDVTPEEMEMLRQQGYQFEII